jgi:hypothetical protein
MKALVLIGFFSFLFPAISAGSDDVGFMWLEQVSRERMFSSLKKKSSKNGEKKKPDMATMLKMMEKKKKEGEGGKKIKKRSTMSRPADFFIRTGQFRASHLNPSYLSGSFCYLRTPDGSRRMMKPVKKPGGYKLYDDDIGGGHYELFAYNDVGVRNGVRYQLFSQYRFRNYSDDKEDAFSGKDDAKVPRPGLHNGRPLFSLVDVKGDHSTDRYATRKYTGDILILQLLLKNQPVPNAPVTVISSRGWQKTVYTDQDGKASFTLIKEIFHDKKVNKDEAPYLVTAEYTREKSDLYNNEPYNKEIYRATRHFSVRPTPLDWKSKQVGFLTIAGSGVAVMFAAGIRRRRRKWYESR